MHTQLVVAGYVMHGERVLLIHHGKLDAWLPVGGHIEQDETPDAALVREIHEETGLQVDVLNTPDMPPEGNVKHHLATPFHVNVHSVGDHDHCCLFYLCASRHQDVHRSSELRDYAWFSEDELDDARIPGDVRQQCRMAFALHRQLGG